jgi:phosphatidyl-myo-inositol dimannoside synthase
MTAGAGRLRIGIIAPEFPPGVGGMHTLAHGLARALSATDHVVVFTCGRYRGTADDGLRVIGALDGRLRADAGRLRASEDEVDVWVLLNAGLIPIAALLRRPAFVYLHGNDFLKPWLGYGSWWLERVRVPYLTRVRSALRRRALRRAAPSIRHLFANSDCTAALAAERLALAGERLTVCPPGVDDCFFQPHEPVRDGSLRLLTVTRLTRYNARKNVDGVLRALALLQRRVALRYTVVGDGDDRPRLQALAYQLGLGAMVEFTGALGSTELLSRYRHADLFVLASKARRDDVEGFGIVYLEASASGVPVICSRAGGAVDAVEPGRNGIILPSSSPADIAAGIDELARTRERYRPEDVVAFAEGFRWPRVATRLRTRVIEALG